MVEEIVKQDTGIVVAVLFCYFQQRCWTTYEKLLFNEAMPQRGVMSLKESQHTVR